MFLLSKKRKLRPAHHWTGQDTICRLASTGGLNTDNYRLIDKLSPGHPICKMCQGLLDKHGYSHYYPNGEPDDAGL